MYAILVECIRVRVGVHVYVACVYGYVCECFMCVLILLPLFVFGGVLQRFGLARTIRNQLQETRTRSGFVLVVDPIHRRFEDRSGDDP